LPPVSSGNGVNTMIRKVMEAIYQSVGGLDVHEETVVACRRRLISDGQAELEIETFRTTSAGLRELLDWLKEWGVTHVAMESTGVYWIPVWNVLEGHFKLVLENAQHLKKVPGRKDDQIDAEWIAHHITPAERNPAISSTPNPNPCKTSSVCSPKIGARCRTSPGVSDNRTGVFGAGTGFALPGYSTNLINSRALTCGSSRTSLNS